MRGSDEKTEILLSDYLDDTLPAAQLAELEAYLEANPRERQVLEGLRAQRRLLQGLPAETAPNDLGEAVTGQLERGVLLEDFHQIGSAPLRSPRQSSRVLLAAAALLLSGGLVAIIYYVVAPPPDPAAPVVAYVPPPTPRSPMIENNAPQPGEARDLEQNRSTAVLAAPALPSRAREPRAAASVPSVPPLEAARKFDRTALPPPLPLDPRGFGGGAGGGWRGPFADRRDASMTQTRTLRVECANPEALRSRVEAFLGLTEPAASAEKAADARLTSRPATVLAPTLDLVVRVSPDIADDLAKRIAILAGEDVKVSEAEMPTGEPPTTRSTLGATMLKATTARALTPVRIEFVRPAAPTTQP